MQSERESKQLDAALDALVNKTQGLKTAITSFLVKLESQHQVLQWPQVLDNFALISSEMNSLTRLLKSEKCPAFRNLVVLPLQFSAEKDSALEAVTEGRLPAITHEIVPDYLRTKPQPEVEEKVTQLAAKAATIPHETMQKQISSYTRILNTSIDAITAARDRGDADVSDKTSQSWSRSETLLLVNAVTHGEALKITHRGRSDQRPGASGMHMGGSKAPSSIKSNMSRGHPYSRN